MTDSLKAINQIAAQVKAAQETQLKLNPLSEQFRHVTSLTPLSNNLTAAIRQHLAPITAIQDQWKLMQDQWKSLVIEPPSWIKDLRETAERLSKFSVPIFEELRRQQQAMQPFWEALGKSTEECERIEKAGWLPHYTIPSEILAIEDLDASELDAALAAYYQNQWNDVKEELQSRVASYEIDDEAKQAFFAALGMHEAGFFKGTARMLFPEFERLARVELNGNTMKGISSQHTLRAKAANLSPGEIEPGGVYGMRLFRRLTNHLYSQTKTHDSLAAIAADPVPNRHAALHGFLAYDSLKSSINMLIMADFIFQVFSAVKREAMEIAAAVTSPADQAQP